MGHEVGHCHVTREDKGNGAGEQTQREQQSANQLQQALEARI